MAAVNHSERKRLIVAKAMQLFARMGYSKVSVLDVSEATGIARTALYRYFRTKREIFDEAIHGATSALKRELDEVSERRLPVARRLELACGIVSDALYGKKEFFAAIYEFVFSMVRAGEDMTERIEKFTSGFKVILRKLVAEGVAGGELRASVNPDDAAEALYALMESVALRVMLGVESQPDRARRRFSAVIATFVA